MMLFPLFAMVLVTFVVFSINLFWRIQSIRTRAVPIRYYRLQQDDNVPTHIVAGTKLMSNLFETPVLFYVAGVLAIVLGLEGSWMIALGWIYVVTRIVHAFIQMTYNNVIHRFVVFQLSFLALLMMWVLLIIGR